MLGSQRCCGAVTVTAIPRSRRQSSCTTRRRACRQLAHSFGPPSPSSSSSSSSGCPAPVVRQSIRVTAPNADEAGHWRRPVPVLQREQSVVADASTHAIRHQAVVRLGTQHLPERLLCSGEMTLGCCHSDQHPAGNNSADGTDWRVDIRVRPLTYVRPDRLVACA